MRFKKTFAILLYALFFVQFSINAQHYISLADLEKVCSYNKRENVTQLNSFMKSRNYNTEQLYANINTFDDPFGNSITTSIIDDKLHAMEIIYTITNPSDSLINKYKSHLESNYNYVGFNEFGEYTKEGKYLFYISKLDSSNLNQKLILEVKNNSGAAYPVAAIKLKNTRDIKITSFTNSFSSLYVIKGKSYSLTSKGKISLDGIAGKTGPNGIEGFEANCFVKGFKYGSLLGKLGKNGKWFVIGSNRTITARENTHLYVKVNDIDPSNNSGHFIFSHEIIPN